MHFPGYRNIFKGLKMDILSSSEPEELRQPEILVPPAGLSLKQLVPEFLRRPFRRQDTTTKDLRLRVGELPHIDAGCVEFEPFLRAGSSESAVEELISGILKHDIMGGDSTMPTTGSSGPEYVVKTLSEESASDKRGKPAQQPVSGQEDKKEQALEDESTLEDSASDKQTEMSQQPISCQKKNEEDEVTANESIPEESAAVKQTKHSEKPASSQEAMEGESGKDKSDRQDWAAIRAISDEAFVSVVSLYVDQTGLVRKCQLLRYEEGGFHRVAFVRITDDGVSQEYVVKVPATGTSRSWTDGDAHSLMCEAELMRLVHSRTTVPVPELIFYDTDLYNHLGAPFILMRAVTGKPAYTFWYDGWEDRDDLWKTAESPSPKAEKFRVNFLRSLAAVMAQLSTLTFDRIGMPSWDENGMSVGHYFTGQTWNASAEGAMQKWGPFNSSIDFFRVKLERCWPSDPTQIKIEDDTMSKEDIDSLQNWGRGIRKIIEIIFTTPAFTTSKACAVDQFESFTLLHNDIDLQNLLVDEDGNITGVLDWDGTIAAPRSIAAAAAPVFLRQDWYPEFNPLEDQPWLCMSLPRYRRIYADALKEFGCSDAKYTEKSPIYQAMKAALSQGGDAEDLIGKLLLQIPEIQRMDVKIVAEAVGKGSPALEELLKDRLPLLLLPEEERKPMASKLSESSASLKSVASTALNLSSATSISSTNKQLSCAPILQIHAVSPTPLVVQEDPAELEKFPAMKKMDSVMLGGSDLGQSTTSFARKLKRKLNFSSWRVKGIRIRN